MSTRSLDPAQVQALFDALPSWFAREQRELPWRSTREGYPVWISEAMLQQTRVEAVLGHYARFMQRFPDVHSLARAEEQEVLAAWSGLGYYRRARALHAAARAVVERHAGVFPRTRQALLELPGVGAYTAGAIASIAFGAFEPLVDGNVARVFARWFELPERLGTAALDQRLWQIAAELIEALRERRGLDAGSWNQALMELGATRCSVRAPRCTECPVAHACGARLHGTLAQHPLPKLRTATLAVGLESAWLERRGQVWLLRRPAAGRMAGLWELPTREIAVPKQPPRLWPLEFALVEGRLLELGERLAQLPHAITRHRIRASVHRARLGPRAAALREQDSAGAWFAREELAELALSGLTLKLLAQLARASESTQPSWPPSSQSVPT